MTSPPPSISLSSTTNTTSPEPTTSTTINMCRYYLVTHTCGCTAQTVWEDCDSSRKHGICTYTPCQPQKKYGQCVTKRCCTEAPQNAWTACEFHEEEHAEARVQESRAQKRRMMTELREWIAWKRELRRKIEKERQRRRRVWKDNHGEGSKGYNSASDPGSESTNSESEVEISLDEGMGEDGTVDLNIRGVDWCDPKLWVPASGQ